MILALALVVLCVLVLGFVLWPLARGRAASLPRESFARAIYRDQLSEIARDVERGVVDVGQAEAARREVERRLLASDRPDAARAPTKAQPVLAVALGLGIIAVAAAFYLKLGTPAAPDEPYAGRAAERAMASGRMPVDLDKAVAGLEAKLAANPDDLDGWLMLGRTEAVRQHWPKSVAAMRHAMELSKDRPDIAAAYGQVLVMADGGFVASAARDAFGAALAKQPDNPQALWYLGLAAVQDKNGEAARIYWRRLLATLPAGGDDRKTVEAALAALDQASANPPPK
jgi:cytochrome c-type biogenesis protein CcmH